MFPTASEIAIAEVYLPPLLVAFLLGLVAASLTAGWMNRRRLGRHFANPSLVYLSMIVIYTIVIGKVFIGI
jgi:hypothetical protein